MILIDKDWIYGRQCISSVGRLIDSVVFLKCNSKFRWIWCSCIRTAISMGTDGSCLRVNMVICRYMFVNSGTWTFARNRYYSKYYFFRICVFRGTSFTIGSWYLLVKAWIKKDCSCSVLINLFVQRLRCFIVGIYVLFVEACVSTMRREKERMYYDSK